MTIDETTAKLALMVAFAELLAHWDWIVESGNTADLELKDGSKFHITIERRLVG